MKLTFLDEEYDLGLVKGTYNNNGRTYFGLVDKNDWEPFCDITSNYPDIDLDEDECLINGDFIACFGNDYNKCIKWLIENDIAKGLIKIDGVYGFKF